jgi:hypothetical protein|tara:strand:- start:5942 stop:6118 length:177 start_codon:yes stop_codon:yes gene_type:complete
MKKYILTIQYDEKEDTVEWLQEELVEVDSTSDITVDDINSLTIDDVKVLFELKDYAKA